MRSSPCVPRITTWSPGATVDPGHVDRHHVHRHGADDRRAPPADEHGAAAAEPAVEAVGVAGGHDRDPARRLGPEPRAVPDALAGAQALHGDDAARERHGRRDRQRRGERRRHDAVQQQARAHGVEPHARVAQQRRAVGGVPVRTAARRSDATIPRARSKRRRCSSNSGDSGSSAVAKCVYTASSSRFGLREQLGQRAPQVVVAEPEPVHPGIDLQVVRQARPGGAPPPPARRAPRRASKSSASAGSRRGRRGR